MERLTDKITNIETGKILSYRLKREVDRIKAMQKLGEYEDAEEQGLLLRLPCKVGDTVYWVYGKNIREVIVYGFRVTPDKILMLDYSQISFGNMGVDVFLTKEEAEQALKQMGE